MKQLLKEKNGSGEANRLPVWANIILNLSEKKRVPRIEIKQSERVWVKQSSRSI